MDAIGSWDIPTIALVLLAFATLSSKVEGMVTPAIFFTTAGLVAGPVLGLVELGIGSSSLKLLADVTLTLVLFSDASRISLGRLRSEYSVPLRLLAIGLPLTIAAGATVGVAVLPGVSLVEALVLGVMIACTDAALGQAVVTDERIPSRIRQGHSGRRARDRCALKRGIAPHPLGLPTPDQGCRDQERSARVQ